MLEKWKNDPEKRDKLMKAAAVLIILAVIFLSFDVFTQNRDGRNQIIDSDGGTETGSFAAFYPISMVWELWM